MFVVKRRGKVLMFICSEWWLASDACVATLARPTGVGRLAGRPVPLGVGEASGPFSRLVERVVPGSRMEAFPDGLA